MNPDTNGDGIRNGMEVTSGKSATDSDLDGDGGTRRHPAADHPGHRAHERDPRGGSVAP